MIVCKVMGTVVCTQKDDKLTGVKLQIVFPLNMSDGTPDGKPLVAVDTIGAGPGEWVLVVSGSSARQTTKTKDTPVDAVIMAIIDTIELEGKITFEKSAGGKR